MHTNGIFKLKDLVHFITYDRLRPQRFQTLLGQQAYVINPDQVFDQYYILIDDMTGNDEMVRLQTLAETRKMTWHQAIEKYINRVRLATKVGTNDWSQYTRWKTRRQR